MKRMFTVLVCFLLVLSGCSTAEIESEYKLYDVNYVKKIVEDQPFYPESEDNQAMIDEIVQKLSMHDEFGGAF